MNCDNANVIQMSCLLYRYYVDDYMYSKEIMIIKELRITYTANIYANDIW